MISTEDEAGTMLRTGVSTQPRAPGRDGRWTRAQSKVGGAVSESECQPRPRLNWDPEAGRVLGRAACQREGSEEPTLLLPTLPGAWGNLQSEEARGPAWLSSSGGRRQLGEYRLSAHTPRS